MGRLAPISPMRIPSKRNHDRAGGQAFAVRNGDFLPWSFDGYGPPSPVTGELKLLTPPAIVKIFQTGYAPSFHPSADF